MDLSLQIIDLMFTESAIYITGTYYVKMKFAKFTTLAGAHYYVLGHGVLSIP